MLIQSKAQFGMQPLPDDIRIAKEAVVEAKALFPDHDTVRMLNVDFMTTEGDFDGATAEIEALIAKSDGDDAIPYVFKANTLAQKVGVYVQMFPRSIAESLSDNGLLLLGDDALADGSAVRQHGRWRAGQEVLSRNGANVPASHRPRPARYARLTPSDFNDSW